MYSEYAKLLGANNEVLNWVNTTLKKYLLKNSPSQSEVEHIIDFAVSSDGPKKMIRMSYVQAKIKAEEWNRAQQKRGKHIIESKDDTELIKKLKDGSRIVKLVGKNSFEREGFLMRHCVASWFGKSDKQVYSLRDRDNNPHVTLEVDKAGQGILQIKGKGNGSIHPKYIHPVLAFLKEVGFEVRDSEMKNLGYHYLDKEMKKLVKEFFPDITETKIGKKKYVFAGV